MVAVVETGTAATYRSNSQSKSGGKGWVLDVGGRNEVTGLIEVEMSTACPLGFRDFPLGQYPLGDF